MEHCGAGQEWPEPAGIRHGTASIVLDQRWTVPWPWPGHGGAKGGVHSSPSYWYGPPAWIIVPCVTEDLHMTNEDKRARILPWVDPESG
jgi:hypothetical protein